MKRKPVLEKAWRVRIFPSITDRILVVLLILEGELASLPPGLPWQVEARGKAHSSSWVERLERGTGPEQLRF